MKRAGALSLLLLTLAACSSSRKTPEATQENFGVSMARMNLWREALFRFRRAVQMQPGDAMAHNNLAVAYEANGDFDNAAKEYREAMRLDKSNTYIQKNYSRFVEFTSRNKKRQKAPAPATKTAAAPASGTTTATPPAAAPAPVDAAPPAVVPASVSGDAPGSTAQPTGTAPAAVPPAATSQAPPSPPPPTKPPGESR